MGMDDREQAIEAKNGVQAAEHSQEPAQNDSGKRDSAFPSKVPESVNAPPPQPATAEQLQKVEREMTSFERATLNFAKLAFVVSVVAAIFVGLQWIVMRQTLAEMRASGRTSTDQIWQAIGNMNWMARTADGSLKQAQRGVDLGERQGKLALNASIQASRNDQRPWVVLSRFQPSAEPEVGVPLNVTFWIVNTGKTPAIRMEPASKVMLQLAATEPKLTDFIDTAGRHPAEILPPGGSGDSHFGADPFTPTQAMVNAYRAGITRIYGHAQVTYRDTFNGSKPHWVYICVWHAYGRPLSEFSICESGNDVDHQ